MKKALALLMLFSFLLSLSVPAAATEKQYDYSTAANSGQRDETCTTLEGTTADAYYTEDYTYDKLSQLPAQDVLEALRQLMTETHTYESKYNDCRDKAPYTDCVGGDGTTVSLIYTGFASNMSQYSSKIANGWNREHVWPKALGGFDKEGAGSDMHHIRPSDQPVNSARANQKYGNVEGGKTAISAGYSGKLEGGTYTGTYFEPLDNVKGDVARICLYVYVRYGGELSKCSDITNVFESVDVLLSWCQLDPVDTWEMGRNEVVGKIQGNRNVFIDYPELAWLIFGKEVPADMVTPSGKAAYVEPPATEPPATQPSQPSPPATDPTPTQPEGPTDPAEKPDYLWIVYAVISVGTVTCVVIIVVQQKKKSQKQ